MRVLLYTMIRNEPLYRSVIAEDAQNELRLSETEVLAQVGSNSLLLGVISSKH